MRLTRWLIAVVAVAAVAWPALAGENGSTPVTRRAKREKFQTQRVRQGIEDPGVNARQQNQKYRIAHGIVNGSLTKEEVQTLLEQERAIAQTERELKSDGVLTRAERKTLHQLLNETSRLIFQEKHDTEGRVTSSSAPRLRKEIRARLRSGEMTRAEAKVLLQKMQRIRELRRLLGSAELTDEQRAQFETELDNLVNELFD